MIRFLQPFGVLHGGITAFLAENLASMGASVVAKWSRVAGIDLNVNHLLSASIGETVHVKATPLRAGKRVQVRNQTARARCRTWKCSTADAIDRRRSCVFVCFIGMGCDVHEACDASKRIRAPSICHHGCGAADAAGGVAGS